MRKSYIVGLVGRSGSVICSGSLEGLSERLNGARMGTAARPQGCNRVRNVYIKADISKKAGNKGHLTLKIMLLRKMRKISNRTYAEHYERQKAKQKIGAKTTTHLFAVFAFQPI